MAFAQEIRDFLSAYETVSGVMQNQDELNIRAKDAANLRGYRQAQIDKWKWDMGAQGREEDAMVGWARSGDPLGPLNSGAAYGGGSAGTAFNGDPDDFQAIMASAARLGADPRDYIALMNKESGIDPSRWGGAGGDHLGLIQFGANERAQFGVHDGQTIQEQLPAVEAFLKARGYQPGMDIAKMYSIVNAGSLDDSGEPRWDASDGNGTIRTHTQDIINRHYPVADNLLTQYAGLSPEGIVADLAGSEAPEDFAVPEGEDVDELTMGGEAPASGRAGEHPLGIYDPDYVQWKEEGLAGSPLGSENLVPGGVVEVPGALPDDPSAVITPTEYSIAEEAGLPGTEPVSLEGGEAVATMAGFDPLPQTTGYTDPVSQAGSADEVEAAISNPPPRGEMLRGILDFGRQMFGAKGQEAVDTDETDPGGDAMTGAIGGAPVDLVERLETIVEERYPGISQDQKTLRVMGTMWNWWIRRDPERAYASTLSIYQTYKLMNLKLTALAQEAGEAGEYEEAIERYAEAYSLIPDGNVLKADKNDDGTYNITLETEGGEILTRKVNLDPKVVVSDILQITPDMFDKLVEEKIMGEGEGADTLPGSMEKYRQGVPGAVEEEPGVAPAPMGGEEPAIDDTPMGVTIPPGASDVPGEEGVQVASADAGVPVATGSAPLPTSTVTTRPKPGAVSQPMSPDEFADFIVGIPEDDRSFITEVWKMDNELYNTYLESLPTEADVKATEAYNTFFEEMRSVPPDQFFDISKSSIAGVASTEQQNALRQIADARNKEYERILTQRATEQKERDEIISTDILERERAKVPPSAGGFFDPASPGVTADRTGKYDTSSMTWFGTDEAQPTQVYGDIAVRGQPMRTPSGADTEMRGLSREDRGILQDEYDRYNEDVGKWNEGLGVRPPLPADDPVMAEVQEAYAAYVGTKENPVGVIDNNKDPIFTELAGYLRGEVANRGMQDDVINTARILKTIPGNDMSVEDAVAAAWGMVSFDPRNPERTMWMAERVPPVGGMPAGMVAVQNLLERNAPPIFIPENLFKELDDYRQQLADDWIIRQEAIAATPPAEIPDELIPQQHPSVQDVEPLHSPFDVPLWKQEEERKKPMIEPSYPPLR